MTKYYSPAENLKFASRQLRLENNPKSQPNLRFEPKKDTRMKENRNKKEPFNQAKHRCRHDNYTSKSQRKFNDLYTS